MRTSVRLGGGAQLADEGVDPPRNLVADSSNRLQVLAGGILELPVLITLARVDRARVSAAHRDHDVRLADHAVLELLGPLSGDVDPDLVHGRHDGGVQLIRGLASRRDDADPLARLALQDAGRHLASPRVVNADEEDFGLLAAHESHPNTLTTIDSIDIRT